MGKTINIVASTAVAAILVAMAVSVWTNKLPNQVAKETGAKISESYKKMKEKFKKE